MKAGFNKWAYSDTYLTSLLSPPRPVSLKSRDANYTIVLPLIRAAASYCWTDENTLELTARFVEEALGSEGVIFRFEEKWGKINVTAERKTARGAGGGGFPGAPGAPAPLTGKVKL